MLIKIWQDITQFGLDTGPNLFCKDPQHLMCELTMVIAVSLIKHSPAKLYGPMEFSSEAKFLKSSFYQLC